MEDGIGYPIPRCEGSYYGYAAAELTDINDNDRVTIMNYIFDETNWADFMSDFVGEIENNREVGFIKVPVRHHLADRIFSWVFRKLDVSLVAVEDGDGEVLYELGDREFSEDRDKFYDDPEGAGGGPGGRGGGQGGRGGGHHLRDERS
ncbi:hypothetical protein Tco_0653704 [Tanacetum coccineum]|uniref:Uncharacterized protein n=1 Tax=Tanacetum coccineum TaxID=301880 RepID=A0ABQ4X1C1_9ASTR